MEAFHRPLVCHLSSKVICPCVDGPHNIGRPQMLKLLNEYHNALRDLVNKRSVLFIAPALRESKNIENHIFWL